MTRRITISERTRQRGASSGVPGGCEKILTEEKIVRESIKQWAAAGDPNAMIKLAEIYLEEGKIDEAKNFLERAAEKNYRPAAM